MTDRRIRPYHVRIVLRVLRNTSTSNCLAYGKRCKCIYRLPFVRCSGGAAPPCGAKSERQVLSHFT